MNIKIGAALSVKPDGQNSFITAYFVGEKNSQHIVITFPENEHSDIEKINGNCLVRYSQEGSRYEFRSRVIDRLYEPVVLITLQYPDEVNSIDKRVMDRINCLVSAKLKNKQEKDPLWCVGVIENINKAGCLCSLTSKKGGMESFDMDCDVVLKCQFPGLVGEQSTEGKVVRIKEDEKNIVLGIQFDEKIWWVPPYEQE